MLVARGGRDRVVQGAVREPRRGDPVGRYVCGERRGDLGIVRRVVPDRGGAGDALLDQRAIVVQRLHLPPDRLEDASRRGDVDGSMVRDERAARAATAGLDDAERGEPRQRLPDRGAADRQHLRQLALGGQLFPGLEHANRDRRQYAIGNRLGRGALPRAAQRQTGGRLIDHRRFGHFPRPWRVRAADRSPGQKVSFALKVYPGYQYAVTLRSKASECAGGAHDYRSGHR